MASITLRNVCIDYPVHRVGASKMGEAAEDRMGGRIFIQKNREYVRALDRINIDITAGQRIGLIGSNGSGKSTLLRTLAGILPIASGERTIDGRISTLFSTSAGIDGELTGVENIHRLAALYGLPRESVGELIESIADFSELGTFMKMPVKTYSAGMRARLGFAFVTSIRAEIVLIDEVIGVGDKSFYAKAQKRLSEFMEGSGIVVLASHSVAVLESLCTRAFVLRNGRIVYRGNVQKAQRFYKSRSVEERQLMKSELAGKQNQPGANAGSAT